MHKDKEDNDFMDILNERGWVHKYHVADEQSSKALNCMTSVSYTHLTLPTNSLV